MTQPDRSDPGARAQARFTIKRARDRRRRWSAVAVLIAVAIAAPFLAEPLTGDPGSTVGAVVAALLFVALAIAVAPHDWRPEEAEHHLLEAIWRELRTDAHVQRPWERYGAWAESKNGRVELSAIVCAPLTARVAGAPSAYSREPVRHMDADEMVSAAEAMERLRQDLAERELEASRRYEVDRTAAERAVDEELLRQVDEETSAYQREAEERTRRELSEREAAERRAQADALARALRRP